MAGMADVGALIVDDEDDVRELMRLAIDVANEGLFVCGEAGDGLEAVEQAEATHPQVVVLDHRMPRMSGLEAARRMLATRPDQRIVLCSAYLDVQLRQQAAALGITTCLPKRDIPRLPEVLRTLAGRA